MDSHTRRLLGEELNALADYAGVQITGLRIEETTVKIAIVDTVIGDMPSIRMKRLLKFRRALKNAGHVLTSLRPVHLADDILLTVRLADEYVDE